MDRMTSRDDRRAPSAVATPQELAEARAVVQRGLHRREDPRLHRRRRARDARAEGATAWRELADFIAVRRQPARVDLPQPGGARARLPAPPRLRHARGRQGDRRRRAAPPRRSSPTRPRPRRSPPRRSCASSSSTSRFRRRAGAASSMLPRELLKRLRKIEIVTARLVREQLAGAVPLGLQGPRHRVLRGAPVHARRRRPAHRLERHGAHERRLRQAVHRGARDDRAAARRHVGVRALRLARQREARARRRARGGARVLRDQEQRPRRA